MSGKKDKERRKKEREARPAVSKSAHVDGAEKVLEALPKKEDDRPSPEQIRRATAGVVLAELEMWPKEIQTLIGEDHPSEEGFTRGPEHVIGAYMHIARKNLAANVRRAIECAGVDTAREMGPLVHKAEQLRREFEANCAKEQADIARNRQAALNEAARQINAEFDELQRLAETREAPDELVEAQKAIDALDQRFEDFKKSADAKAQELLADVADIEEGAKHWNSKSRRTAGWRTCGRRRKLAATRSSR